MKANQKKIKKTNAQDKTKDEGLNNEDLQKEIEKYLLVTQELKKFEQVDIVEENKLLSLQQEKKENLKKIIEEKNMDELFNLLISNIKSTAEMDLCENDYKTSIENLTKKNRELYESTNLLTRKYNEFDNYNKNLLEKIKELNEEKKKIEHDENEKKKEIEKKCLDFKNEVTEKFSGNFPEVDKLKEDNDYLQVKLDEYRENTEKIRDNILSQLKLRDEQTLETEKKTKTELREKMKEIEKGSGSIKDENKKLTVEVTGLRDNANKTISKIQKIGKDFENKKKEFEKLLTELSMALKENRDLKERNKSFDEVRKENERIKKQLEELTSNNRKLHEKLKVMKELVEKKKENNNL